MAEYDIVFVKKNIVTMAAIIPAVGAKNFLSLETTRRMIPLIPIKNTNLIYMPSTPPYKSVVPYPE